MTIWDTITGRDIARQSEALQSRAEQLPTDYQVVWNEIKANLWPQSDFSGRNLIPILDGVLGFLEETAAEGRHAREALGDDIAGFCAALAGEEDARSIRDKWREELNGSIARKLNGRERR